jgi:malate dehydrogenase
LTKLLGTSAWYAPGAAVSVLVQSIICNQKKMIPCSLLLEGEYGEKNVCTGVPAIIGANGVEKIVEITLTDAEKAKFAAATAAIKEVNADLKNVL